MAENKISVVIADDHPLFRAGVKQCIDDDPSMFFVAEACNGEEALELIHKHNPDIAVLDIQMPKLSGLAAAQKLKEESSRTSVILLTMFNDQNIFFKAIDQDVKGYVLKDAAVNDIVKAIHSVAEGKYYLSPELSGLLVSYRKTNQSKLNVHPSVQLLTSTERHILLLISELKSNKEIADELFVSKRTIENHRTNIAKKLGLTNTNGLLKFAVNNKAALKD
ncbi:MAG: response regulator transcription factor [Bacteroidetes bacterium]|nr:response regulator transcription factor [Bacteroidota bacterium]